jgi:endoglycosylceramidase
MAGVRRALGLVALLVGLAAASPAAGAGYVRAPGGPFMTDAQGRRLQLHGVNLVAKCGAHTRPSRAPGTPCIPDPRANQPAYVLTPTARDPGRRFTRRDARTLRELGFTYVRLGIIWEGLEPGPAGVRPNDPRYCSDHAAGTPYPDLGAADPYDAATVRSYLRKVDRIERLLAAQGMKVLIDMHQDAWGSAFGNPDSPTPWTGEGAPLWATCTNGMTAGKHDVWQQAYFDPAVERALAHFWSNDVNGNLEGNFARVWSAVARHFAGRRSVMGYEIFNEPADPTALAAPEFDRRLQCFYAGSANSPASCLTAGSQAPAQGVIAAIEAAAPRQLVYYEAPVLTDFGAPNTVGVIDALPFPRLGLSFHDYGITSGTGSFGCKDPSCGPAEEATFNQFAASRAATRTNQPGGPAWTLTEFGAEDYVPDVARMADLADQHLASWQYWAALQLHDPTGGPTEALIDERTRRPDPRRAAVLARTYPLATAGVPRSQRFDPASEAFDYTYTSDPNVRAPTQIVVPTAYHYPHGYIVSVRGGAVTSKRNARLLTIRNEAGVHDVVVEVRRAAARNLAGLPRRCRDRRKFRFTIQQPKRSSIVRVDVFVNGRLNVRKRGRRVRVVKLRPLPRHGRFRVKVVAYWASGQRTVSVRTYDGCHKSRPRTSVRR